MYSFLYQAIENVLLLNSLIITYNLNLLKREIDSLKFCSKEISERNTQ